MTLQAVFFDFGGVFTDSPFELLDRLGAEQGAQAGQLNRIVFGPYEQDTDHPWHQAERGELDLVSVREQIITLGEQQGLQTDLFELLRHMAGNGAGVREQLIAYVRELRASGDYKIGMITNNVIEFRQHWRAMLPVDELFDVVIDSCEVGLRKPNPAIFEHALGAFDLAPQQAVFLDDHIANVQAAQALGMQAIHVTADEQHTITRLAQMLAENAGLD